MRNFRNFLFLVLVGLSLGFAPAKQTTTNPARCGANGTGVAMCFKGRTICVAPYLVPTYQRFGGTLGACN